MAKAIHVGLPYLELPITLIKTIIIIISSRLLHIS